MLGTRSSRRGVLKLLLVVALVAVSTVGPAMAATPDATAESTQTTNSDETCVYYHVHTERRELVCVEEPDPSTNPSDYWPCEPYAHNPIGECHLPVVGDV